MMAVKNPAAASDPHGLGLAPGLRAGAPAVLADALGEGVAWAPAAGLADAEGLAEAPGEGLALDLATWSFTQV